MLGDEKGKEIAAKHYKTTNEEEQREMAAKRLEFRDFLGTSYYREVNLKPLSQTPGGSFADSPRPRFTGWLKSRSSLSVLLRHPHLRL